MKYQRLTREERYQIAALRDSGLGCRGIGRTLGRNPSTISRELRRNCHMRGYTPKRAHHLMLDRRKDVHPPFKITGKLANKITKLLNRQWSPEQISGRLRITDSFIISHETIYHFIYRNFKNGGLIYLNLRRKRKRRRTHEAGKAYKRCGATNTNCPSIRLRPREATLRIRLGDYERDTLLGIRGGPALLSIVDRTSRLTRIGKIERNNAEFAHRKTVQLLRSAPLQTITNDNGKEFTLYQQTAAVLKTNIFFNDPYSSWQRGTNENTNGLIRQYFPKGTNLQKVSDREIKQVEKLMNNRPRKCLGYRTPLEVQTSISQNVALRV